MTGMTRPQSKVTAQGQISIPAEIRRKMGISPGSVLEWEERDEEIVVRRVGKFTSEDIHRVLFPDGPPDPRTDEELEQGIEEYFREKYARR
jgi:antitoxin PrlF